MEGICLVLRGALRVNFMFVKSIIICFYMYTKFDVMPSCGFKNKKAFVR